MKVVSHADEEPVGYIIGKSGGETSGDPGNASWITFFKKISFKNDKLARKIPNKLAIMRTGSLPYQSAYGK